MKTLLTTAAFILIGYCTSVAQIIGDIHLADINADYMQLTFDDRIGGKVSVNIDYGQASAEYHPRDTQLRTDAKKAMEFNSVIDAINFLGKYDYGLSEVYTLTKDATSTPFYILKKESKNVR